MVAAPGRDGLRYIQILTEFFMIVITAPTGLIGHQVASLHREIRIGVLENRIATAAMLGGTS